MQIGWSGQPLGVPALALYLADLSGIAIDGNSYAPLVADWGEIDRLVDPVRMDQDAVPQLRVSVVNAPTNYFSPPRRFSELFRQYRPEAATVTVSQWFEGESFSASDLAPLFVANIADPIEFDEEFCSFDLVDIAHAHGQYVLGNPVTLEEYPGAPEASVGKVKPVVLGSVEGVPAVPVNRAAEARVASVVLAGGTLVDVDSTDGFPSAGTILINDDEIGYTSKNATQFLGCSGINEFHYSDDVVLEKLASHRYLVADPAYPVLSIGNVRAGEKRVADGDFTVDLALGEIVFNEKPRQTDSVDTKFLQVQMDEAGAGNTALDPANAMVPNSPATYARINQGANTLALKQTDSLAPIGEIGKALVRVEHFVEEKLASDNLTVEIPGIGSLGQLPPPATDDGVLVVGDVDIEHDTLIGSLDFSITDPQHSHTEQQAVTVTQSAAGGLYPNGYNWATSTPPLDITFPTVSGTRTQVEYVLNIEYYSYASAPGTLTFTPRSGGNGAGITAFQADGVGGFSYTTYLLVKPGTHTQADIDSNTASFAMGGFSSLTMKIIGVQRIVTLDPTQSTTTESTGTSTSRTGALATTTGTKSISATGEKATRTVVKYFDITANVNNDWTWFTNREVEVKYNGSADGRTAFIIHVAFEIEYARRRVKFTDAITADVEGVKDDAGGTITGTPGALIERPDHVYQWSVLKVLGRPVGEIDAASFASAGSLYAASGYRLAGVVQDKTGLRGLWRRWGWESRSWFRWDLGRARILFRPRNRVDPSMMPAKLIPASQFRLGEGGKTRFRAVRTAAVNLVNAIDLRYRRRWSAAKEYSAVAQVADPDSMARHGRREQPGRFEFDWVRDPAMAADLSAFYLDEFAEAVDIYDLELFLDNMELEAGDIIELNPPMFDLPKVYAQVLGAGRVIGSGKARRMDSVPVTARTLRGQYGNDGYGVQSFGTTGFGGVEVI
ncbi:MAG: hypothetical protein COV67_09050 [Nitrospinae bacterium CG11_big_fil_rev_8_21_14_0_20_56_8]|nr:MAG: hypothetical protein COV67_09050 [Nitrospinae bacterium CG11_big_fil_rev_8_21_14_0_20_56_8]